MYVIVETKRGTGTFSRRNDLFVWGPFSTVAEARAWVEAHSVREWHLREMMRPDLRYPDGERTD